MPQNAKILACLFSTNYNTDTRVGAARIAAKQLLCSIGRTLQVLHLPILPTDSQQEYAMHHVLCLGAPRLAAAPCEGCK